jgi:hypothetical protein
MRKNKRLAKYISIAVVFLFAILFVAKFAGPSILRLYIESGIGSCQKIPILCLAPEGEAIINPDINKEYMAELLPYKFPKMEIAVPRGFSVVQQRIKKVYYKRKKFKDSGAIVYVLSEPPGFFVNLFPQLKNQGVKDDYEFIKRTMYAKLKEIENPTDAFFAIMKGVFTPDLGNENKVIMTQFRISDKKGFINYNLTQPDNYFDCNVIDNEGGFFKIYIKDKGANLDLNKVMAIISTLNKRSEVE